ncbi:MAG: hypothetical protein HDR03_08350 [Lachnospiraceae bacterium]|nr:hypothetical protein [Lachnospiraceae bacterium]
MIIKKCTFDELPDAMQMHVLYSEKIPVAEYRLAIWSNKDTLYYNNIPEKEIDRFITLIENDKKFLNNRTMNSIYNKYGFAVYYEIHEAHSAYLKKGREKVAEQIAQEYFPIIEKTMKKPSIPYSDELLKAMSHLADKGKFKFKEWSTDQAYIYFMGYLLGSGKLKWEEQLS